MGNGIILHPGMRTAIASRANEYNDITFILSVEFQLRLLKKYIYILSTLKLNNG